jgi:hypothetical protein
MGLFANVIAFFIVLAAFLAVSRSHERLLSRRARALGRVQHRCCVRVACEEQHFEAGGR